ncbi:MAG: methyltransferase domain-containing protein, partial [Candidatus Heimdallarchaeota archaeon]
MECRQCQGIEVVFDQKSVQKDLEKYRKKGPSKTTRILIDFLKTEDIKGKTVLDIGGGVGAIQHELLKNGMSEAISVDASSAYIEASREEAERQGFADRIVFFHGDYVELAPRIPDADVVCLDRVICCYHDMEKLIENSISHARKYLALIYPPDSWWMKFGCTMINLYEKITRSDYRAYVHSKKAIHRLIRAH